MSVTIQDLYQKVQDFEARLSEPTKRGLKCKQGCSACCHQRFSVFSIEADHIKNWFAALSESEKKSLLENWREDLSLRSPDDKTLACVFLDDKGACTIYPARPLICRTQGLPLALLKEETQSRQQLDICPLNRDVLAGVEAGDILNLDLLNTILSHLQRQYSSSENGERVCLSDLQQQLIAVGEESQT